MYWNISEPLSYNALFNFIIGNRGGGKTFGCKKYVIEKFLKTGEQFVYVRRYEKELKNINKFFNDVAFLFPDVEFKIKGKEFLINKKLAGYAIPLSTSKILKSTPYPDVKTIIFDEFLLDKGFHRYLPNEIDYFLDLYETIARTRDNVIVFFLSNAISVTNPYFLYFDLVLPKNKKKIYCKNDILIQLVVNAEFIANKKKTRFAKIIKDTDYAKHSIDNEFFRDNNDFIIKQPEKVEYYFTIKNNGLLFGVWVSYELGIMYVSKKVDKTYKLIYTTSIDEHTPNTMLLQGRKSSLFNNFIDYYKKGQVYFDSINTKNIILKIIKKTL